MDISPWSLIGAVLGWLVGFLIIRITRKSRAMKKNRKKHDPLKYYSNRSAADFAAEEARLRAVLGGYWGGTQAHRVGAAGSPSNGAGNSPSAGTGTRMSTDEFSGVDLIIEPALEEVGFAVGVVRGVRSFDIDNLGRLTGVTYKQIWKPGQNEAICRRDERSQLMQGYFNSSIYRYALGLPEDEPFRQPEANKPHAMHDCKHGFYAYYDGSDDYHNDDRVSAVVEGYGETVIGSRGFRSMKARIVALHIPETIKPHVGRMIARNYPDVRILETFDQMVTEFPPDSQGNEITPDSDPNFWTRPA